MLTHVDRIQVVVHNRATAADTYAALFDAAVVREDHVTCLGADRTVMQMGVSDVELLEPTAAGPARRFLNAWGEGLFAAGFHTSDMRQLRAHFAALGVAHDLEQGQLFLHPGETRGLPVVITQSGRRDPVGTRVRHLYEVTNLVDDWQEAAAHYAALFKLDAARFQPIVSEQYGYTGTLTMFAAPERLDRIEVVQITDPAKPMGRFKTKRGGPCLYMCYVEVPEPKAIIDACEARGARWAPHRLNDDPQRPAGLYVHPSGTHGVLIGVSRPDLAWAWSGDPARAGRA